MDVNLLNSLIVLTFFISILLRIKNKYTGFIITLFFGVLVILLSAGDKLLLLNNLLFKCNFDIFLMAIILSFSSLLISLLITANIKIINFIKNVSFSCIKIKNFLCITLFVLVEEIYFRVITLSFFIYLFNNESSAILITSIIFLLNHVDTVKSTNVYNYITKMFDLFIFSVLLSVVFVLLNNFLVVFFIHLFRNIVLTGIRIKSPSDSNSTVF